MRFWEVEPPAETEWADMQLTGQVNPTYFIVVRPVPQ